MGRALSFALFFGIVLLVVGGLHWYFYIRLIRGCAWPAPWHRVALWTMFALALSMPLTFALSRFLPHSVARFALFPAFLWMGMGLFIFSLLLSTDLLKLLAWSLDRFVLSAGWFGTPEKTVFWTRLQAGLVLGVSLVLVGVSIPRALAPPQLVSVELRLPRWPATLDGLRVAQLTDLHLGWILNEAWMRDVVDRVQAQKPDLIVITGDLADGSPAQLGEATAHLKRLQAPLGVFFITGNHEFYAGWPAWRETIAGYGIAVLENRRVRLERAGAAFELAGINDFDALRVSPADGPDLDRALADRDPALPLILLSHQVRVISAAAERGVDLVLSGHNHGGQLWPWGYFVYLQQPVLAGLARRGDTWAYVSEGTGFWGPPMRLGTRGEISLITLRAERGPD